MPAAQAPGAAAGFDAASALDARAGAFASGIDELVARGALASARLALAFGAGAVPAVGFGFAPAHATASAITENVVVSTRRMSAP
jgi:hypothetical protein